MIKKSYLHAETVTLIDSTKTVLAYHQAGVFFQPSKTPGIG